MTDLGRCSKCGALCAACRPRDGFSLTVLDESVRDKVEEVLGQTRASQAQQDRLVLAISTATVEQLKHALRIWNSKGYGSKGYGIDYFRAIVEHTMQDAAKDKTLDRLPPWIGEVTDD